MYLEASVIMAYFIVSAFFLLISTKTQSLFLQYAYLFLTLLFTIKMFSIVLILANVGGFVELGSILGSSYMALVFTSIFLLIAMVIRILQISLTDKKDGVWSGF